jgi:NAD(P)-dependent dehydrogenase (short-subunit alcohol dehydrogenase family)
MKLTAKRILIVGATSGIGLELTSQLLDRECTIYAFSRSANRLLDRFPEFAKAGRLQGWSGDLRRKADIRNLYEEFRNGSIIPDGIICAAGVSRPDFVDRPDIPRSLDTIRTNLLGPIRLIYEFLPLLLDRAEPTFIAGFTGMVADRGVPRAHALSAAKAGLDRFLESLRIDLYDRQVRVFTVVPGFVKTPMSDQNHFPMPGQWAVEKSVQHILRSIEREIPVIRFPWYHSLGMVLMQLIPPSWYAALMNRYTSRVIITPHPNDEFRW